MQKMSNARLQALQHRLRTSEKATVVSRGVHQKILQRTRAALSNSDVDIGLFEDNIHPSFVGAGRVGKYVDDPGIVISMAVENLDHSFAQNRLTYTLGALWIMQDRQGPEFWQCQPFNPTMNKLGRRSPRKFKSKVDSILFLHSLWASATSQW